MEFCPPKYDIRDTYSLMRQYDIRDTYSLMRPYARSHMKSQASR